MLRYLCVPIELPAVPAGVTAPPARSGGTADHRGRAAGCAHETVLSQPARQAAARSTSAGSSMPGSCRDRRPPFTGDRQASHELTELIREDLVARTTTANSDPDAAYRPLESASPSSMDSGRQTLTLTTIPCRPRPSHRSEERHVIERPAARPDTPQRPRVHRCETRISAWEPALKRAARSSDPPEWVTDRKVPAGPRRHHHAGGRRARPRTSRGRRSDLLRCGLVASSGA